MKFPQTNVNIKVYITGLSFTVRKKGLPLFHQFLAQQLVHSWCLLREIWPKMKYWWFPGGRPRRDLPVSLWPYFYVALTVDLPDPAVFRLYCILSLNHPIGFQGSLSLLGALGV